ncbi:hypothetical protein SKAU_G00134380 [Synaphobranchus kaupii]|uniref:Receptor activity modifying protein 2 n=1 Tax=Synaphobranchus kaupii TaxID=118154 RepID=A0A9Q1J1I8_SYNKA|nr:hypothetical protein SKAU_G00134380 [Synaphobranchus kaupii]
MPCQGSLDGGALQTNITMEDGTAQIKEDDESFQMQDQFHVFVPCNETLLDLYSHECQRMFEVDMHDTNTELWCDWESVIRPYNKLTQCMEYITSHLACFFPNHIVQEAFLQVHSHYFQHCRDQHEGFSDAPHYVAIALTLVPVSLIPVLVFLVVWKSKVRE